MEERGWMNGEAGGKVQDLRQNGICRGRRGGDGGVERYVKKYGQLNNPGLTNVKICDRV